jgi:hypothetical protein
MTSPASDHSESASAQSLLQDFDLPQKKNQSTVSLPSLEDGEETGCEFEHLRLRRRQGLWTRLRMSMRKRRNGEAQSENFKSVKLGTDEKRRSQGFRWRKRTILGLPVLAMVVL